MGLTRVEPNRLDYDRWLRTVQYRNASFNLINPGPNHAIVDVSMERDASPGSSPSLLSGNGTFTVHSYRRFPLGLSREQFMEHIFYAILYAEEHETAEFFLVDGDQFFHPHRPGFQSRIKELTAVSADVPRW